MIIDFTTEERQFVQGLMIERSQDANLAQYDGGYPIQISTSIASSTIDLNPKEVGFLQFVLQEQSEIHGRRSSTANEKMPVTLSGFVPQKTLQLVKSVSDKLGASILIDTQTPAYQGSPRGEGSLTIMKDPTLL